MDSVIERENLKVHWLGDSHRDAAVELLGLTFSRDLFVLHLHDLEQTEAQSTLKPFFEYIYLACQRGSKPVLGLVNETHLQAVACLNVSGKKYSSPQTKALLQRYFDSISEEGVQRSQAYHKTISAFQEQCPCYQQPHHGISVLGVHPRFQGRGYGTQLMQEAIKWSRAQGNTAGIAVETLNPANIPFYERLGFQRLGEEDFEDMTAYFLFFLTKLRRYFPHELALSS